MGKNWNGNQREFPINLPGFSWNNENLLKLFCSVLVRKWGNVARARMRKPYLASFRRFCAWCFNIIHRHTWIYKAHILTKSTERASLQLQSTASNATSQNAAFTTVVEDQHNLLGHTSTYIIRRTDLLIQASRLPKWNLLGRMRHK